MNVQQQSIKNKGKITMQSYYFTFGTGQKHVGKYVEIHAETYVEAREKMYNKYESKWAFQYSFLNDVHPQDRHLLEVIE